MEKKKELNNLHPMILTIGIILLIFFIVWMEFFSKGPGELIQVDPFVFESDEESLLALCEMALFPFKQVTWRKCLLISVILAIALSILFPQCKSYSMIISIIILAFVIQYVAQNFMQFHGQVAKHLDYVPRIYHKLNKS
jgi:hypothetical protein